MSSSIPRPPAIGWRDAPVSDFPCRACDGWGVVIVKVSQLSVHHESCHVCLATGRNPSAGRLAA